MVLNVYKLSSSKFRIIAEQGSWMLMMILNRDEHLRTASLSVNTLRGDTSQSVTCRIVGNNSLNNQVVLVNEQYTAAQIAEGLKFYNAIYETQYFNSGHLDLILRVTVSSNIDFIINFSEYNEEFNLNELYTMPEAEIISASGVLNYNNLSYVNFGSEIKLRYSNNSIYNNCNPAKSFIGFKYEKVGQNPLIIEVKSIDDSGEFVTISPIIPNNYFSRYDGSEVSLYIIREDDRGNTAINTYYLGYFYILPRLINPRIEVYSALNKDLKYDIKSGTGTCIILNDSRKLEFKLSFDVALGQLSSVLINIAKSNNVIIISDLARILENEGIVLYNTSFLEIDNSEEYTVTFLPAADNNNINYNQVVYSQPFKLLNYIAYSFSGIDTDPVDPESCVFDPTNPTIQFIKGATASVNSNTSVTIHRLTNLSMSEFHSSISNYRVTPSILEYNITDKILNQIIIHSISKSYSSSETYYSNLATDGVMYSELLREFNINNSADNKFFLMHEICITINNKEYYFYQYIGRLHYVPEVIKELPISISAEGNWLTLTVNPQNYYVSHENGVISKYEFRMMDGNTILYISRSDENTITFLEPQNLVDGRFYKFIVNLYYTETNGETTSYYTYYSNSVYLKAKVDTLKIHRVPTIIYPNIDMENPNNYFCYSYYNKPYFLLLIQLPRVRTGTSGTPSPGDNVYDGLKIVINDTITKTYQDYPNLFIGELTYLEKLIILFDTSALEIASAESYNIKIYVSQNYGGVTGYGEPAEITVYGSHLPISGDREANYNGKVQYIHYKQIFDAMEGFCRNYSKGFSSPSAATLINNYAEDVGKVLRYSDLNKVFGYVKDTINDVNEWMNEVTTSSTEKLIDDSITFDDLTREFIVKEFEGNFIEQMYNWIHYIYNQYEYEPEENFITIINPDNSSECIIIGYLGSSRKVNIPPTIRGKTTAVIGVTAFGYNTNIQGVIVPPTVYRIE